MRINFINRIVVILIFLVGLQACQKENKDQISEAKVDNLAKRAVSNSLLEGGNSASLIIPIEDARAFALGFARNMLYKEDMPSHREILGFPTVILLAPLRIVNRKMVFLDILICTSI